MGHVIAEVSLTPLDGSGSTSVSYYVARALAALDGFPNLSYQLNAMGTVIEGEKAEVLAAIDQMAEACFAAGALRVSTQLKIDERRDKRGSIAGKIASVLHHKPDARTGLRIMFKKIMVANRGEIALRIVRACRELGVRTVVAYSEADRDSLAVRFADEAVCIGPAAAARSYLNIPSVVTAAVITGADAIHPGSGFLSENSYLAEVCQQLGITFIGPTPEVIEQMSDKTAARRVMQKVGLPIIPGNAEPLNSQEQALTVAKELGYPVVLKAVAGGGGRGTRMVRNESELNQVFGIARTEALAGFGNADLYLEKLIVQPRHIEVQILADNHGHIVHLGTRDCSLQRRHQKVLEEAPGYSLPQELLDKICAAAIKGAKGIGYRNAGTFEFLVDRRGNFYFLEVNPRIQVEHGITEMITGIDLIKWQIMIASGQPLTLTQKGIRIWGHSIECRINAEDPNRGFRPDAGTVELYLAPGGPGVRMDSHLYSGYVVPPHYDSLLGKLMTWGETRDEAIARMRRALSECVITGVKTIIPLHQRILSNPAYLHGNISTVFIQEYMSNEDGSIVTLEAGGPRGGANNNLHTFATREMGDDSEVEIEAEARL